MAKASKKYKQAQKNKQQERQFFRIAGIVTIVAAAILYIVFKNSVG